MLLGLLGFWNVKDSSIGYVVSNKNVSFMSTPHCEDRQRNSGNPKISILLLDYFFKVKCEFSPMLNLNLYMTNLFLIV